MPEPLHALTVEDLTMPTMQRIKGAITTLDALALYYEIVAHDDSDISESLATGLQKAAILRAAQDILVGKPAWGSAVMVGTPATGQRDYWQGEDDGTKKTERPDTVRTRNGKRAR